MIHFNKTELISRVATLAAALGDLPDADTMVLGGEKLAKADILVVLVAVAAAAEARKAALLALKKALACENATLENALPLRRQLKSYLEARFGKSGPELVAFGITPARVRVVSVETKRAAIEKSRATRKARHTMGSRQKKAITGEVPATRTTPDP